MPDRKRNQSTPNTYDQVLYLGLPYASTHPERLATLATLYGIDAPPAGRCRVLELGAGDGGNLIPMAFMFPDSTFTGFDLAEKPIALGREEIRDLGLENIRLDVADIMDLGPSLGEFDYIIAHGFYSWVPEAVRDRLMSIAHRHLAPRGVVFISFNALPGCRVRQMLRDMMLFHIRDVSGAQQRIEGAREFLQMLLAARDIDAQPVLPLVEDEVQRMLDNNPWALFHDELVAAYFPTYFSDFVEHASRHGLQYLCEASLFDLERRDVSPGRIEKYSRDRIEREQYLDFLAARKFHRVLLVHQDLELPPEPISERVRRLYAASEARAVGDRYEVNGETMDVTGPLERASIDELAREWPRTVHFDELHARCVERVPLGSDPGALSATLLSLCRRGLAELHVDPRLCAATPGERPSTTALIRRQATRGTRISTLLHTFVQAQGPERQLLTLLDGTRDREALAAEMEPSITPRMSHAEFLSALEGSLRKLARFGLLSA